VQGFAFCSHLWTKQFKGFFAKASIDRIATGADARRAIKYRVDLEDINRLLEIVHLPKYERDKYEKEQKRIREALVKLET